jgi:hypothetical protein
MKASAKQATAADRVTVLNPNVPGYSSTVERTRYEDVRKALLKALPKKAPGMTQNQMMKAVLPHLSRKLFPGGAKASWWTKCVQLDLEARGAVIRDASAKPLRWTRAR